MILRVNGSKLRHNLRSRRRLCQLRKSVRYRHGIEELESRIALPPSRHDEDYSDSQLGQFNIALSVAHGRSGAALVLVIFGNQQRGAGHQFGSS
jgi:hypothetical protein